MILHPDHHIVKLPQSPCGHCGKPSRKKCQQCKAVYYCSRLCQKTHWQVDHKEACCSTLPADPSSVIRSYMKALGRENVDDTNIRMPSTVVEAQRLSARLRGKNQGVVIWNLCTDRVSSPEWMYVREQLVLMCSDKEDFSTFFIQTRPPHPFTKDLNGHDVYWTLALTYAKQFGSYHLGMSDHDAGIQRRVEHFLCGKQNEVTWSGVNRFTGDDQLLEFSDTRVAQFIPIDWFTGLVRRLQ